MRGCSGKRGHSYYINQKVAIMNIYYAGTIFNEDAFGIQNKGNFCQGTPAILTHNQVYWSSTAKEDGDALYAKYQAFYSGDLSSDSKDNDFSARAVRVVNY